MIHWELDKIGKILTYEQMVYAQPRIRSEKWDVQIYLGF